ncbi:unnamed protein product [Caenorhabditis auriculariae]|uniref:Uncharacterized protein n=1 Tax=Caenorhabditis auriculariae TaxID=2777116 RepID=A0A8S1GYB4_9PELO|nr:unnamed protein product [Caenorhabditis auriculariae]
MSLEGRVAVVTGASRGIGRGIALQLAEAGFRLFITARKPTESLSTQFSFLPTLEDTANECRLRGSECREFYVDHGKMEEVAEFFELVARETNNQLDILVNNAFSAVTKCGSGDTRKFFEKEPEMWDEINNVGLRNQYYCSVYGARIMNKNGGKGFIVNISSLGGIMYLFNVAYGAGKMAIDRMSADMAHELLETDITVVSLWPGAVRTELIINMLENSSGSWGKTENAMFLNGESIEYSGKCVVALANDPLRHHKTGSILITSDLGRQYGFSDTDGRQPANLRSLRGLLQLSGYLKLGNWVPSWFTVPGWVITLSQNKILH